MCHKFRGVQYPQYQQENYVESTHADLKKKRYIFHEEIFDIRWYTFSIYKRLYRRDENSAQRWRLKTMFFNLLTQRIFQKIMKYERCEFL